MDGRRAGCLRAICSAAVLGAGAALAWGVRGRSSALFAPSVYRGRRDRPAIALTFDDGPSESTPVLLELLARYSVPATFFQCGLNAARLPRVARDVALAGHEVGNHSHTHRLFPCLTPAEVREDLARAQRAIEDATGVTPRLFRAPYGARWFGLRRAQRELGLLGVMWTSIALDWKLPSAAITRRILRAASNGAILCLHDGRELRIDPDIRNTATALRGAIPALAARGFCFETVSNIL